MNHLNAFLIALDVTLAAVFLLQLLALGFEIRDEKRWRRDQERQTNDVSRMST